jgi:hypothetical protein
LIEENNDGFRLNCAEGTFNSKAGISRELSEALLIDLRFTFRKRTIGEFLQIGYVKEETGRWARQRQGESAD